MRTRSLRNAAAGFMILEVLLALLIFSLGVLGLIGLQANAAKLSGQSQYRATATLLANELVGTMWAGNRTTSSLQSTYADDSTDEGFVAWKAKVAASLPGASTYPPVIAVQQITPPDVNVPAGYTGVMPPVPTPSTQVSITMRWRLPSETSTDAQNANSLHNIVMFTQIK